MSCEGMLNVLNYITIAPVIYVNETLDTNKVQCQDSRIGGEGVRQFHFTCHVTFRFGSEQMSY